MEIKIWDSHLQVFHLNLLAQIWWDPSQCLSLCTWHKEVHLVPILCRLIWWQDIPQDIIWEMEVVLQVSGIIRTTTLQRWSKREISTKDPFITLWTAVIKWCSSTNSPKTHSTCLSVSLFLNSNNTLTDRPTSLIHSWTPSSLRNPLKSTMSFSKPSN